MINVDHLTKRYGTVVAVDGLSFEVGPGRVTGFLGPNGAGKTTTLRMLLGLTAPTSGTATIDGVRYRDMRQRLTLATTLLGDPGVLILDEPLNGLDPDGIRWMRDLLRQLARDGRTVLVSSHLLAEAAQTVDDVVVINRGRLAAKGPVPELTAATSTTRIRTPDAGRLMSALGHEGITAGLVVDAGTVEARGADPDRVARIAASAGVIVLELTRHTDNLEDLFFDLVSDRADDRTLEACPS